MCCFSNWNRCTNCNSCSNCNRRTNVNDVVVLRGPIGPQGPVGPAGATGAIGPQGPAGTSDALYALNTGGAVADGGIIPIALSSATPATTLSVTANAVNIPQAGSYLITYYADGVGTTGTNSVTLYQNGTPIANGELVVSNGATRGSASRSVIVNTTGASTVALYNTSGEELTLTNASITVLKLA